VQAASEKPDTSSDHLFVERVDIAAHRFVLCDERVVVVGVVNRNQKLGHDFSGKGLQAGRLPCLLLIVEWPNRNSTIAQKLSEAPWTPGGWHATRLGAGMSGYSSNAHADCVSMAPGVGQLLRHRNEKTTQLLSDKELRPFLESDLTRGA
jgi:hypothetical protein